MSRRAADWVKAMHLLPRVKIYLWAAEESWSKWTNTCVMTPVMRTGFWSRANCCKEEMYRIPPTFSRDVRHRFTSLHRPKERSTLIGMNCCLSLPTAQALTYCFGGLRQTPPCIVLQVWYCSTATFRWSTRHAQVCPHPQWPFKV